MPEQLPVVISVMNGCHADYGSEHINHEFASQLNNLMIRLTTC